MSVMKVSPIINAPCSNAGSPAKIQILNFFKEMFPFYLKVKIDRPGVLWGSVGI